MLDVLPATPLWFSGVKWSSASRDSPEISNKNSHPNVENSLVELRTTNQSAGTKKTKIKITEILIFIINFQECIFEALNFKKFIKNNF